jgi:hypothetical protein
MKPIQKLLEEMLTYIEQTEVTIDGEWGSSREWEGLVRDGLVPELYKEINQQLTNLK